MIAMDSTTKCVPICEAGGVHTSSTIRSVAAPVGTRLENCH